MNTSRPARGFLISWMRCAVTAPSADVFAANMSSRFARCKSSVRRSRIRFAAASRRNAQPSPTTITAAPVSQASAAWRSKRASSAANSAAVSVPSIQNWATPASFAPSARRSGTQASSRRTFASPAAPATGAPDKALSFVRGVRRAKGRSVHSWAAGGSSESSSGTAPLKRRSASNTRIASTPRNFDAFSTASSSSPGTSVTPSSTSASAPSASCMEATADNVAALPDRICCLRPSLSWKVTKAITAANTVSVSPTTARCA